MTALREEGLSVARKGRLAARVLVRYALARRALATHELPRAVELLAVRARGAARLEPERLARAVDRTLRLGSGRPTCLVSALVLFQLLREQGDEPELVIGLQPSAPSHEAHAWVELHGRDVGPPPGRGSHESLARFR